MIGIIINVLNIYGQVYLDQNDASEILQSAFNQIDSSLRDQNQNSFFTFKTTFPISFLNRRRSWRFKFPFGSLKNKQNPFLYGSSEYNFYKPFKFEFDESLQPIREYYQSSKLSFPNLYGFHSSNYLNDYKKSRLNFSPIPNELVNVYKTPSSSSPFSDLNFNNEVKNKLESIKYLYGGFKPILGQPIKSFNHAKITSNVTNSSEIVNHLKTNDSSDDQMFSSNTVKTVSKTILPMTYKNLSKLRADQNKVESNNNCVNKAFGWCDLKSEYPE